MKIFKYLIEPDSYCEVSMKTGASILSFQAQGDDVYIWALVDPDADEETRYFRLAGTGHEITEREGQLKYIGTAQYRSLAASYLVLHLFELFGADPQGK